MKNNDLHHIYGAKNYRMERQKKLIAILCIVICILCLITCAVLIKGILDRRNEKTATSQTTVTETTLPAEDTAAVSSETSSSSASVSAPSGQTVTAEERSAALTALSSSVSSLLDAQAGRYSVYYINLSNGETLGYKETDPMVAASSIKIAYNTYLYQQAAAGAFSMDESMAYDARPYPEGDLETGTGTIQNSPDGTQYTLSQLSNLSICISDNCATNMILRKLGGIDAVNDGYMVPVSAVINYRSSVSYTDYAGNAQNGRHRTSAKDLALYAKNLYDLYKASPDQYTQLIEDLKTTEYSWGIPAGIKDSVDVAHKVGFNPAYGSNNDVGIVFGKEDYVLCVMTESGDGANGQSLIGQVSGLVSDYIAKCYS